MLKNNPLLGKIIKKSPFKTESKQKSDLTDSNISEPLTASFKDQKEVGAKLVHSLNKKKVPSLKQVKHLPKVLSPKQHLAINGLIILIVVSIVFIGANFYFRNFLPAPTEGGEYVEGLIGAPQYVNPLLSQTNDVDSDIARLLFSGLLNYDNNLQLVPDLAATWEESEDQKTYTFVLKENLTWHDDEPLTADDVIFTFLSLQDPDFKSPLLISFRGVDVEKVDERTVKFILPEAFPAFLEVLTVGILPEHIWGEIPPINANLTEYNLKPIGSGPWKFKSLTKDKLGNIKSYTLVPYENYQGPKPYLEKITFKFYPDFETSVNALKSHSVEGLSFLPKELKSELSGQKNLKYFSFYLPQYTAIFFNQKENEILKDKNIRKALAFSIDKSEILSEALQLEGEIIDGPILPVSVDLTTDQIMNFDVDKANQILDEAGWQRITPADYDAFIQKQEEAEAEEAEAEEADAQETTDADNQYVNENESTAISDEPPTEPAEPEIVDEQQELIEEEPRQEFYRQKNDAILELKLTTVNQPENVKASELIQQFWQSIGVKVNLKIIEGSKISREIIKPRNYEILLFGIIVGSNPDPYPFWHSSQVLDPGLNLALLANREVDKLLEDAKTSLDPEVLQNSYQRFQDILSVEIPAIFLHNPTYTYVTDQKIKGVNLDRIIVPADRFNNLQDWYIKTKRRYQGTIE